MTRLTLMFAFALSMICASVAFAQDSTEPPGETPCMDVQGEDLNTCLQEALDRSANIVLPQCPAETEADADRATCMERRATYQRILGELSGNPCAGFEAEEKQTCLATQGEAAPPKKKGLSKHEGTKMERLEGTGDEDE